MPPTVIFEFPEDADDRWRKLPDGEKHWYPCWECGKRPCDRWENASAGFWRAYCEDCAAKLEKSEFE